VKLAFASLSPVLLLLLTCTPRLGSDGVTLPVPNPVSHDIEPRGCPPGPPTVRVKVAEGPGFRVSIRDSFVLYRDGVPLARGADTELDLSLRSFQPPVLRYSARVSESETRLRASLMADSLRAMGIPARIREAGRIYRIGKAKIDNRKFLVLAGPFRTEDEARAAPRKATNGIIREIIRPPSGEVEMAFGDGIALVQPGTRIVPQGDSTFPLAVADSEDGTPRRYEGVLEIQVSTEGSLLLVNELPLEDYLRGVIPHEMGPGFPPEALKAQAVAARSFTLAYLDLKPSLFHEPYDFGADVSCQVYGGDHARMSRTDSAVTLTRGQVLVRDGELVRGFYSSCCGGHTEGSSAITMDSCCFIDGVSDLAAGSPPDLRSESGIRDFLDSHPYAHCGFQGFPEHLSWLGSSFRWRITLRREEIEASIRTQTGRDVGDLISLRPLERGISGRITRMEVSGTRGILILDDQLEVRRALRRPPLKSSMFYVTVEQGPDGLPERFTLVGGGYGHGVGLCQTGATAMALKETKYRDILAHYYAGCRIVDLY
jgi:SpoIID/LytB domain protein